VRGEVMIRMSAGLDDALGERIFDAAFARSLREHNANPAQVLTDLATLRQLITGQGLIALLDAPWLPIFLLVAFIYPVSGHWIWGGGYLGSNNFRDFAGSTVVHSVGGWAALAGVIVGSLVYALATRRFRIEWFTSGADFGWHATGGALMGIGGVLAMGCTVGQAITGISTLAIGSILTFMAIVIGSAGTMKFQYWRMMQEA